VDAEVEQLVRAARLHEAALLARKKGDPRLATDLFERACAFEEAGRAAMAAGDPERALLLAVQGGENALAAAVLEALAATNEGPARCERVGGTLEQRGESSWAAAAYARGQAWHKAARCHERAGEAVAAATLHEKLNDVLGAARVLETELRRAPEHGAVRLALGELLLRYGKTEAAVRTLQRVGPGMEQRTRALALLVPALEALGLPQAAAEAKQELDQRDDVASAAGAPISTRTGHAPASRAGGTDRAAANLSARLFGRYEAIREIASTPTARVVECTDPVRGELVAVKIFAADEARGGGRDALARFEREVRVLAALDHPNVVPLRDYVPEGPALVLAWMSGGTLEERLLREPLSPARAVEIAVALLSALGEAHRLGVLHRDIKPSNVLFDDAGVARLADFGVAHLGDLSVTATAGVIGTLAYMSPEQREGRPATVQSDLYGVGAILLEMLTAERLSVAERARLLPSASHRDLDARHDAVVQQLLAPEPSARPLDAFAARRALTSLAWPDVLEPAAHPIRARAVSERPEALRALTLPGSPGFARDQWLERAVELVPLSEATMMRARAFARAGHRALQAVLRVDRDAETIWLEALDAAGSTTFERGAAAVTAEQRTAVTEALEALHGQGAVHGHIDSGTVVITAAGEAKLRFGKPLAGVAADAVHATADDDRLALAMILGATERA
jgi:tetratricopeptide (TPR) repeat protein